MKRLAGVIILSSALLAFQYAHKTLAESKPQFGGLFNIYWNQTDFEQGVSYDGLQIATINLQQLTCDVVVVDLNWDDGTIAKGVGVAPFPTPPGNYPIFYKPTGRPFPPAKQYHTNMHATLHAQGAPVGDLQLDFPQTITVHERIPIAFVKVPKSVVGGKSFNIIVDITDRAPSYLSRIDFKWIDPNGLIVVDNKPVSVQKDDVEVTVPVQTKPTRRDQNVQVTISTLPDHLFTKKIKVTAH